MGLSYSKTHPHFRHAQSFLYRRTNFSFFEDCNYTRDGNKGIVTSPNYPVPVPRGQFCSWRITVVQGYQVNLKFDEFSLSGNESDRVEVFDGGDDTAPALGVFTGNHVPPPLGVNSSLNTMFVVLRSSSTNKHMTGTNGGKFRAFFSKRGIFKINRSVCAMRVRM